MKRSIAVLGLLAAVAAGGAACSDETPGQATPGSTTTQASVPGSTLPSIPFPSDGGSTPTTEPSSGGQGGPLASTDPCTLSAQAAAQVNAGSGANTEIGEGRGCHYQANGVTVDVTIYDTLGLDDVVRSGQPQQTKIGGHDATRSNEPPSLCMINIGTSDTSRVDVLAGARGDQSKACQVATQVATAMEPSLPRG